MSEQADAAKLSEIQTWLIAEWSNALGQSIESMTGERVAFERADSVIAPGTGSLAWEETLSFGTDHTLTVVFPEPAWNATGRNALIAIGIEDPDLASVRGTFLEIIRQATSVVIRSIGAKLGREVTSVEGKETAAADDGDWIRVQGQYSGEDLSHGIRFSAPMLTALLPPAEPERLAGPPTARAAPAPADAFSYPPTLDLLLDVELPVSVSFGRAQVPLKEVLKLTSGSIVELNRTISEPVEVIVNNCVIARGEVVVVEGNYGIRINHIVNRQERLRTLH